MGYHPYQIGLNRNSVVRVERRDDRGREVREVFHQRIGGGLVQRMCRKAGEYEVVGGEPVFSQRLDLCPIRMHLGQHGQTVTRCNLDEVLECLPNRRLDHET